MDKPSRRTILRAAGVAALAMPATSGASALSLSGTSGATARGGPRFEGKDTPKICLEAALGGSLDNTAGANDQAAAAARRIRQLGVKHGVSGGGPIPWEESRLQDMMGHLKTKGHDRATL